jgi:flagellar hook protein FlgE
MFDIMSQARDAIVTYNAALQVHTSNIANMSVTGYKRLDVSFQSLFEKVLRSGTAASTFSNLGGTNPQQYGQGVGIGNIKVDFTQGSFTTTNLPLDLSITGGGLFIVSPDAGASYLYTRAGKFSIINGSMVTETGLQVYGLDSSGALVPITGLAGTQTDYGWTSSGELYYQGTNTGFRIALTTFPNAGGLQQAEGTTLRETMTSGSASSPVAPGGSAGLVTVGQVEASNVFYLGESIDATEVQRALSANLSVVKMASDMISSFISKLG